MAKVSITDAAKLVQKDRRTIQRAIKSGKISVTKSTTGMPEIDTAELDRVYKIVALPQTNVTANNAAMSQYATEEKPTSKDGLIQNVTAAPQINATANYAAMSQNATGEKDKIIALLEAEIKGLQEDKAHYKALFEEERKRFDRLLPAPADESTTPKPRQGGFF